MKQLIAVCLILTILIAGCTAAPGDNANIPNPASVFCEEHGGTLKIVSEAGGQVGVCKLPDGSTCEEWAYYRAECPPNETEPIGMPNPAAVYCEEHGGTIEIVNEEAGQRGICILADGKRCDEWAYYRGECQSERPANVCTEEQKNTQACTLEYAPACGWWNSTIQCIKYPCAATYGNKCQACADAKVAYWTVGECPGNANMANPASVYCEEQGGVLDIVEGDGQVGVCTFPSGFKCDEWAYYRGECPP